LKLLMASLIMASSLGTSVTRLGEFSTIRLLFVGLLGFFEMKKWPKNGDTFGNKFITFSAK
jgi:hypothetical protein